MQKTARVQPRDRKSKTDLPEACRLQDLDPGFVQLIEMASAVLYSLIHDALNLSSFLCCFLFCLPLICVLSVQGAYLLFLSFWGVFVI